jgi:hypothetical protein
VNWSIFIPNLWIGLVLQSNLELLKSTKNWFNTRNTLEAKCRKCTRINNFSSMYKEMALTNV